MNARHYRWALRGMALLIALLLPLSVLAATTTQTVGIRHGDDQGTPGSIVFSTVGGLDSDSKETEIKPPEPFQDAIEALREELDKQTYEGELNAKKTGAFETVEDAKNGIFKITFDVVTKSTYAESDGLSVMVQLLDEISGNFTPYFDATHPLTLQYSSTQAAQYDSFEDAQEGDHDIQLKNREVTWNPDPDRVSKNGARLSFYIKLDDGLIASSGQSGAKYYPSNGKATMEYEISKGGDIQLSQTVTLSSPAVQVRNDELTAIKTSDRLRNNSLSGMGVVVQPGEAITYIITVRNTGTTDKNNVIIRDEVPQFTTFVEAESTAAYDAASNAVTKTISTLRVGESATMEYTVRVSPAFRTSDIIENYATFGLADTPATLDANNNPICRTNILRNPGSESTPPKTGDTAMPALWVALMALSAFAGWRVLRRKWG